MKLIKILFLLNTLSILVSCGGIQTITVKITGGVIYDASKKIEQESSFTNFKDGVLSNLQLTEAFWYLKQNDEQLLVSLIKGYSGYALAVNETLYLNDQLRDIDESAHKDQAIINHTKSMEYGIIFLQQNGISFNDLILAMNKPKGIENLLDDKFSDDHLYLEGIMYFGQALASLINLQRDNMEMITYLPIAKSMYDWVCIKKPNINFGACNIYYGAYEAARPKMLGGNPKKGKKLFKNVFKNYPHNWLARAMYIQFYLIPLMDEKGYLEQKEFFKFAKIKFKKAINWNNNPNYSTKKLGAKGLRFYQALAIKRFNIISKHDKDLF